MQVIVDYFQLSQMKSCRKEPQRSRNYLLQQLTNSFNKIQTASKSFPNFERYIFGSAFPINENKL